MEKIESFRKGRMWLNVFRADSGELALTIKKSYPAGDGKWKYTDLINPGRGDIEDLEYLLERFKAFKQEIEVEVL
jgi:hypothetical protein